jgi:hypothetical protein
MHETKNLGVAAHTVSTGKTEVDLCQMGDVFRNQKNLLRRVAFFGDFAQNPRRLSGSGRAYEQGEHG